MSYWPFPGEPLPHSAWQARSQSFGRNRLILNATDFPTSADLLAQLDMKIHECRYERRLSSSEQIRLVLEPEMRAVLHQDLAKRHNLHLPATDVLTDGDLANMLDEMLTSWFRIRAVTPHYI